MDKEKAKRFLEAEIVQAEHALNRHVKELEKACHILGVIPEGIKINDSGSIVDVQYGTNGKFDYLNDRLEFVRYIEEVLA